MNLFIKFRLKFVDVQSFFNFKCRKIITSVKNCEAGVGVLYFAVRRGKEVFKDMGVFVGRDMFFHPSRNMAHCFTNITAITSRTSKLVDYTGLENERN